MMTKERKAQEITALSERFGRAKAAFLVDFKGLNVEQVTRLRKALHPIESEMKVVRNTLAIHAVTQRADFKEMADSLTGTNAIVFAYGDATAPAKMLQEFQKDVEALQVKSAMMDGKTLSEDQVKYLATLPGKNELRAQLLGVFAAPMTKFLGTMQAVPAGFARVLNAYKEDKENKEKAG
jgi:large subunit ribosomal protein L10